MHPRNRQGAGASGSRCEALLKRIIEDGFDDVEANSNGVVVQQNPATSWIEDWNREKTDGDEMLAPVVAGSITHGTLSHGHLVQICRNILAGVSICVPGVSDDEGKLSLEVLRVKDSAFAHAIDIGLQWEVLSYKMDIEEPHAAALIQGALNKKNSACLVNHEMEAMRCLAHLTVSSVVTESCLSWQAAQVQLRETLPQYADDDGFLDLHSFVVDMGGFRANYLEDILSFHEKFVDPMVRRIRLSSLAVVNLFPLEFPHLKIASVKFMYRELKVVMRFCQPLPQKPIKQLVEDKDLREASVLTEDILRFFHVDCQDPLNAHAKAVAIKFYGNLDKDLFGILIGHNGEKLAAQRRQQIIHCGLQNYSRLKSLSPEMKLPPFEWKCSQPSASSSSSVVTEALQPRIIEYAYGKPVNQQAEVQDASTEQFGWHKFMRTSEVRRSMLLDEAKNIASAALHRLALSSIDRSDQPDVYIRRHAQASKTHPAGVFVCAAKEFSPGQLVMIPCVQPSGSSKFLESSTLAHTLPIRVVLVGSADNEILLQLVGAASLPKLTAKASEVTEPDITLTDHDWQTSSWPSPFWCVRRFNHREQCNCDLQEIVIRTVTMSQPVGSSVVTESSLTPAQPAAENHEVHIPVLVNFKDIRASAEVCVFWPGKKIEPKAKASSTWKSAARKKFQAEKTKSKHIKV